MPKVQFWKVFIFVDYTNLTMPKYLQAKPRKQITLQNIGELVGDPGVEEWVKALVLYLYYYGVRISEALKVSRRDFNVFRRGKREYLQVSSATLKNPTHENRILYVPLNAPYLDTLLNYMDKRKDHIWDYTRQWSRVKIQQYMPEASPHAFRHNRLNEFAQAGETAYALKSWAGWSDTRPGEAYVQQVDTRAIADRFFRK
jgi:integrase